MAGHGAKALDRALAFFSVLMEDKGRTPLAALAHQAALPVPTAHRLVLAFERKGLIARAARGRYIAGMRLAELVPDWRLILIQASRAPLRRLALDQRCTAHLGILEGDMVTYLIKEGGTDTDLFTREMMQFEAYCTGIGKVLLGGVEKSVLDRYLSGGPFVRMTPATLTEPARIRAAVEAAAVAGHAFDDAEMAEGLYCAAVPIRDPRGRTIAAISLSSSAAKAANVPLTSLVPSLTETAQALERKLWPARPCSAAIGSATDLSRHAGMKGGGGALSGGAPPPCAAGPLGKAVVTAPAASPPPPTASPPPDRTSPRRCSAPSRAPCCLTTPRRRAR